MWFAAFLAQADDDIVKGGVLIDWLERGELEVQSVADLKTILDNDRVKASLSKPLESLIGEAERVATQALVNPPAWLRMTFNQALPLAMYTTGAPSEGNAIYVPLNNDIRLAGRSKASIHPLISWLFYGSKPAEIQSHIDFWPWVWPGLGHSLPCL